MNIEWEIMNAEPQYELLTVRYSNAEGQEYWRNFNPMLWTEEAIRSQIEGYGPHVAAFFERVAEREADVASALPQSGSFIASLKFWLEGEMPPTLIPEEPEYDPFHNALRCRSRAW